MKNRTPILSFPLFGPFLGKIEVQEQFLNSDVLVFYFSRVSHVAMHTLCCCHSVLCTFESDICT